MWVLSLSLSLVQWLIAISLKPNTLVIISYRTKKKVSFQSMYCRCRCYFLCDVGFAWILMILFSVNEQSFLSRHSKTKRTHTHKHTHVRQNLTKPQWNPSQFVWRMNTRFSSFSLFFIATTTQMLHSSSFDHRFSACFYCPVSLVCQWFQKKTLLTSFKTAGVCNLKTMKQQKNGMEEWKKTKTQIDWDRNDGELCDWKLWNINEPNG